MPGVRSWIVAGAMLVALAGASAAEARCAGPYHQALSALAGSNVASLEMAVTDLTAVDPALPGGWLHGSGRGTKGLARSEQATVNYLWRVVKGRGVLDEFDKQNGRFVFLVTRTRDELASYVRQPASPGLCSGGPEVMGFYDGNLAPLRKRKADFEKVAQDARNWVKRELDRLTRELAAEAARPDSATSASETANPPAQAPAASAAVQPPPQFDPAAPYADLLVDVVRARLGAEMATRLATAPKALERLRRLTDVDAAAIAPLRPVLRAIEAGVYADHAVAKFVALDDALASLIAGVKAAHARHCRCAD